MIFKAKAACADSGIVATVERADAANANSPRTAAMNVDRMPVFRAVRAIDCKSKGQQIIDGMASDREMSVSEGLVWDSLLGIQIERPWEQVD